MYKSSIKRPQKRVSVRKKTTYDQKAKRRFRASKCWKEFRDKIKEERKFCEITGAKLSKMWQLHHMDLNEEHYENLEPENFVCLSWNMHKCVHFLFCKSKPKEWRKRVLNLIKILKKMEKLNQL